MEAGFDIGGRLDLALDGLPERDADRLAAALDPCARREAVTPDLVVERLKSPAAALVDVQRDAGDGRLTASDGARFYVVRRGRRCTFPALLDTTPARVAYEPGFPPAPLMRMLRPLLQVTLHHRRAVAVHGAAVTVDGRGVIVAGWSESGKTETALALAERGAAFLSDKWTVVGDDLTAAVFPIGVGVRGWTLAYLPRLRAALAPVARRRLAVARGAATVLTPLRDRGPVDRAVMLADRVSLPPSAIARVYAGAPGAERWRAPLGLVAVLTTVPDGTPVDVRPAEPAWAARRLVRTADFERRGLFELHDRASWALGDRDPEARGRIRAHEQEFLEAVLARARVIEVRSPFPTDPRPVADAIARHL